MNEVQKIILIIVVIFSFVFVPSLLLAKATQPASQISASLTEVAKAASPLTAEQILLAAKPAVVRIGMKVTGDVSYPDIKIYQNKKGDYFIRETKAGMVSDSVTTGWTGSGFIVNPGGYIITNAHVVDNSVNTVSNAIWDEFSNELLQNLLNQLSSGSQLDQLKVQDLHTKILNFISQYGHISNQQYTLSVFDPNQAGAGSIDNFIDNGWQVELKKVGEPYPQSGIDVAVIKAEKNDLMTVRIGDSSTVKTADRVFVLGYPGIADLNQAGYLEPTLTSGIVSALKPSSQGDYNVIQIDAAISGGNSGGPVFNDKGEVIGIATFGSDQTQGYNWILPINLAKDFLKELNVENTPSIADQYYQKGLNYFSNMYYSNAKAEFASANALYPNAVVQDLISKSDTAIARGEDKGTVLFSIAGLNITLPLLVGIIVVILAGAGVLIWLWIKKKKSNEPFMAQTGPQPIPQSITPPSAPLSEPLSNQAPQLTPLLPSQETPPVTNDIKNNFPQ